MKKIIISVLLSTFPIFTLTLKNLLSKIETRSKANSITMHWIIDRYDCKLIINKHYVQDPNVTKRAVLIWSYILADALATAIVAKAEENEQKNNRKCSWCTHWSFRFKYDAVALASVLAEKIDMM